VAARAITKMGTILVMRTTRDLVAIKWRRSHITHVQKSACRVAEIAQPVDNDAEQETADEEIRRPVKKLETMKELRP